MFLLKALRQLVWRLLLRQKKKMLQTKRHVQCQCFLKFLAHINMFQQHYLGNKKRTFLTCNPEHVYAAILESSKNKDLFQNRQTYFHRILEMPRNFLDMVSVKPAIPTRNQIGAVNQKPPALPKKKSSKAKRERKAVEQKVRKRVARGKEAQIFRRKREVQVSRKRKVEENVEEQEKTLRH